MSLLRPIDPKFTFVSGLETSEKTMIELIKNSDYVKNEIKKSYWKIRNGEEDLMGKIGSFYWTKE